MAAAIKLKIQQVKPATWTVAAYLLTFGLPFSIDISLIILVAGTYLCRGDMHSYGGHAVIAMVWTFLAVVLICSVHSHNPQSSFTYGVSLVPAVMLFILIRQCSEPTDRQIILISLMAALLFQAGNLLIAAWSLPVDARAPANIVSAANSIILVVPNDILFFVLTTPFLLFLYQTSVDWRVRCAAMTTIVVTLLLVMWLQSRTALLVVALMLAVYFLVSAWRLPWRTMILASLVLGMADLVFGFGLINKVMSFNDSRLPLWQAAWAMFLEEPVTGFGPHMYGDIYQRFFVSEGFAANVVVDNRHTPWPHNLYLELLAEYGLIGSISFSAVVFAAVLTVKRHYILADANGGRFLASVAASGAGFLLAGFFELSLLRLWVVIYLFILLSFIAYFKVQQTNPKTVASRRPSGNIKGKNYA